MFAAKIAKAMFVLVVHWNRPWRKPAHSRFRSYPCLLEGCDEVIQAVRTINQLFESIIYLRLSPSIDRRPNHCKLYSQKFQCPMAAFSARCSQCNRVLCRWSIQCRRWLVADLWHGTTIALRCFERQNESCEVHLLIWRHISHDQNGLLLYAMCHHTETRNGRVKLVTETTL